MPNHPPVAVQDSGFVFDFNTPVIIAAADILANDHDPDNDPLSIISLSNRVGGATQFLNEDGDAVFEIPGKFWGTLAFDYTVSDGELTSKSTVWFTIAAPDKSLFGDAGDNVLDGGEGNDNLVGFAGADTLNGGGGDDWLTGSGGDDHINGGTGHDVMWGSAGNDVYEVDDPADVIIEDKDGGVDEVRASIDYQLSGYNENLVLIGDVDGTGNKLDNTITGSGGSNALSGGIGRDRLEGGGDDVLTGGRDSDTFAFKSGFGHDIITDFAVAGSYSAIGPDHDILEFDHSVFADAAALFAHGTDTGDGLLITSDSGDTLLLQSVTLAHLQSHPEDLHFV